MAQEARGDGLEFKTRKTTARGDGLEFKTRKTTATREMAVLDDFKKRYKVQFPTLIVSKIIEARKQNFILKVTVKQRGQLMVILLHLLLMPS